MKFPDTFIAVTKFKSIMFGIDINNRTVVCKRYYLSHDDISFYEITTLSGVFLMHAHSYPKGSGYIGNNLDLLDFPLMKLINN